MLCLNVFFGLFADDLMCRCTFPLNTELELNEIHEGNRKITMHAGCSGAFEILLISIFHTMAQYESAYHLVLCATPYALLRVCNDISL